MTDRRLGLRRLQKEYKKFQEDPPEGIFAAPESDNWFTWYYVVEPTQAPYAGGQYLGKIKFPAEYPFKPPDIYMLTPSGRFEMSTKICMSMSSFHPETWDSAWTVRTLALGILSFLYEDGAAVGCVNPPPSAAERERLAAESREWNRKHKVFKELFPERIAGNAESSRGGGEPKGAKGANKAKAEDSGASSAASSSTTKSGGVLGGTAGGVGEVDRGTAAAGGPGAAGIREAKRAAAPQTVAGMNRDADLGRFAEHWGGLLQLGVVAAVFVGILAMWWMGGMKGHGSS